MSQVDVLIPAPPEQVFSVLEDPRSLRILVPGARRIRRFDPRWPEPGSVVHHTVGLFPFVVRDTTEVTECHQDLRLVLEARVHLIGVFRVSFSLQPDPVGTRMTVDESIIGGLAGLPGVRAAVDVAVRLRNLEMGRRFVRLVERRDRAVRLGLGA